jgi:hypothetical protein
MRHEFEPIGKQLLQREQELLRFRAGSGSSCDLRRVWALGGLLPYSS